MIPKRRRERKNLCFTFRFENENRTRCNFDKLKQKKNLSEVSLGLKEVPKTEYITRHILAGKV
jgi:hypothetical protein